MGWYSYDNGRARKNAVQAKIAKLSKKGERFDPLVVQGKGNKISATFWGQAWCRHLENHGDYENRLPRGRSYLRQGNVYNLTIEPGTVSAVVAGSELYETRITINPLAAKEWKGLVGRCGGHVGSMLDLLAGKLGEETIRVLTDPADGLFPRKRQINFNCSCPDWADMCKHVAAVLYGVGVLLDSRPELLFVLRDVDQKDLLGDARAVALDDLAGSATGDLGGADLSALFGIDLGGIPVVEEAAPPAYDPKTKARRARKPAAEAKAPKRAVKKQVAAKSTAKKQAAKRAAAKTAKKKVAVSKLVEKKVARPKPPVKPPTKSKRP